MSYSPLLLDLYARDTIADRLQQAGQHRLASQLPRHRAPLRHHLARALRDLAVRLDPSAALATCLEPVRTQPPALAARLNGARRS